GAHGAGEHIPALDKPRGATGGIAALNDGISDDPIRRKRSDFEIVEGVIGAAEPNLPQVRNVVNAFSFVAEKTIEFFDARLKEFGVEAIGLKCLANAGFITKRSWWLPRIQTKAFQQFPLGF